MSVTHRWLRYALAIAAAAAVVLFPAACDMIVGAVPPPGPGPLGSTVDDPPGDNGSLTGGPSDEAGGVTVDAPPDAPADSGNESPDSSDDDLADDDADQDEDASDDENDSGDSDDSPPGDSGADDGSDDSVDDGDNSDDDGAGDDDPPASSSDVPDNEYCADVAEWSGTWADFEQEVLALVNQHRAAGADCGAQGTFNPAGPLTMDPALRCAARAHSMDMNLRDFFSHTNPDGDGPGQRLDYAGYSGFGWGENIAWGYGSPASVVAGWMGSDGHCANIMRPQFTSIGVGYYEGNYWTQTFGAD